MMKALSRVMLAVGLVATLVAGAGSQTVKAQAFTAYTSGVQVANLEATDAQVTLTAYKADGTTDGTPLQDTITANGSKTYFPIQSVSNGFQGAIVISSSKKIAAISNILSSDFKAGGSYVGSAAGSTTVLLPLLNKNNAGFNTWFSVQNAGTAPANVTINYSDSTSNSVNNLAVGAAKVFFQAAETHNAAVFAATITSNQPVVAAVLQENPRLIFAYTGFTGGSTNPVFPLINANNPTPQGYVTGLQIQNAGNTATSVEVSYTPATGTNTGVACKETQTIQPGASNTFALAAFTTGATIPAGGTSDCAKGNRFVGAAQVTGNSASQPLVGIGNQLLPTNGGAYGAFDPAGATNKVVMPLIMDRNSGFFTGFNLQNIGTAANVTCTFSGGVSYSISQNLATGGVLNDLQINKIKDKYVGGATCTADNAGAKLVAIVNELGPDPAPPAAAVDLFLVYEGAPSN